jgi:hypothetical protein
MAATTGVFMGMKKAMEFYFEKVKRRIMHKIKQKQKKGKQI